MGYSNNTPLGGFYCKIISRQTFASKIQAKTFWATVCKTVRPMLSVSLSVCPVCDVRALWPNGWTDQDENWYAGRTRPLPYCVRWGPSSRSPKGAQPPAP